MAKKKNIPTSVIGNMLIYSEEYIMYYSGIPINIDTTPRYVEFATYSSMFNETEHVNEHVNTDIQMTVSNFEQMENIKLDDTTMKRIAKFNKGQEIKRLEKEIKNKKEEIEKLDDILEDKSKRVKKIKEFVANIYDIDIEEKDYEDYL